MRIPKELQGPYISGQYHPDKANLILKNTDGEHILVPDVFPAMFIKKEQWKQKQFPLDELRKYIHEIVEETKFVRIKLNPYITRAQVDIILDTTRDYGLFVYEADVNPIRRWFSDTGALVATTNNICFFDIETRPNLDFPGFSDEAKSQHLVISISAFDYQNRTNKFFFNPTVDEQGEHDLLVQFIKHIKNFDTLLAWNGKDYDFYVLRERAKKLGLKINWRLWNCIDYMLVVKKCLMSVSEPEFKRSFALDNIGKDVLGISKIKTAVPVTELHRLILEERVDELKAYNDNDVAIMYKLEDKREFFALHSAVCSLCRHFPDNNSLYPNSLADGLMLRIGIQENVHFKSRYSSQQEDDKGKFKGAFVSEVIEGYHQNVQVIDFASLYPSIMISWNMSPETKRWENRKYPSSARWSTASASGIQFRSDFEGILPKALRTLIEKRKEYSNKMKASTVGSDDWKRFDKESTALKVVANSMYGLLGSSFSRYYDREIAESVTLTGQYLTKEVIKFVENKGYHVIFADTDSSAIKATEDETRQLIEDINNQLIVKITKESGCRTSIVRMDYDKGYKYLLVQAKKKYAGKYSLHKGRPASDDMEPQVKGLEFMRSDQIRYAQRMQMHFLKKLLEPDCNPYVIEKELREWADSFMNDDISRDDIEISQAISKDPTLYPVKTPHVKVALQMLASGKEFFIGQKIPYIIVSSKDRLVPIHAAEYDGNFDREYYWTTKIFPLVDRLIKVRFPNIRFEDLYTIGASPRQTTFTFEEKRLPMKPPTNLKIKYPKKQPRATIVVTEDGGFRTIKGIGKLIKSKPGNILITIIIKTEKEEIVVSTNNKTTKEILQEIPRLFPSASIRRPVSS